MCCTCACLHTHCAMHTPRNVCTTPSTHHTMSPGLMLIVCWPHRRRRLWTTAICTSSLPAASIGHRGIAAPDALRAKSWSIFLTCMEAPRFTSDSCASHQTWMLHIGLGCFAMAGAFRFTSMQPTQVQTSVGPGRKQIWAQGPNQRAGPKPKRGQAPEVFP